MKLSPEVEAEMTSVVKTMVASMMKPIALTMANMLFELAHEMKDAEDATNLRTKAEEIVGQTILLG